MAAPDASFADLADRAASAALSATDSYRDIAAQLVRLRDLSAAERVVGLVGLRQVARELGTDLVVLARTIEVVCGSARLAPSDDPRLALPLLRALADSLIMLDAADWQTLVSRPLASPAEVQEIAASPRVRRLLARAAGDGLA